MPLNARDWDIKLRLNNAETIAPCGHAGNVDTTVAGLG